MTNTELIEFVKNFNKAKPFDLKKVISCMGELSPECHELLVMLVNFKNEKDFTKKLKKGVL